MNEAMVTTLYSKSRISLFFNTFSAGSEFVCYGAENSIIAIFHLIKDALIIEQFSLHIVRQIIKLQGGQRLRLKSTGVEDCRSICL